MMTTTHRKDASDESAFRGFARAENAFDEAWLEVLLGKRRVRLGELLLKCFGRTLTSRARGLADVLTRDDLDLEAGWPPAIGHLRRAMLRSPHDPQDALVAATALALHQRAAFEVTLYRPESFLFGKHLLPPAIRIVLSSDGALELDGVAWEPTPPLLHVTTARRDVVLLPALPFNEPLPAPDCTQAAPTEEIRTRFANALALIARVAPFQTPWVERVARAFLPVATPPGTATSSSFEDLPGVIALSFDCTTEMIADTLVHEASHQHIHFLEQLGPVDDGTDGELYWSPARRAHRPIGKILLAYHAFVNVHRFWIACREHHVGGERTARMIASYEEALAELRRPLDTTRALTPIGRALIDF